MIKEGKISGEAIVGEGRSARINVALAMAQIGNRTDPGQRLGNGVKTNLTPPAGDAPTLPTTFNTTTDKIAEQKLKQAEIATRRAEAEERARQGEYVLASDARAAMTRTIAQLLRQIEGGLPDMASKVSGDFQLNQRDVLHVLKSEFTVIRAKATETLAGERDQRDRLVEAPA
ncbi:MAG: hypothetical protein AAGL24_09980 [Pseudomonadota bacterium]